MTTLALQAADLGGWTHDISPVLIDLGGLSIRWYGLSYLAGFAAAYLLLRFLAGRGATVIPRDRAMDAILTLVMGVVVGGRLGYVLLYDPKLLGLIDGFPYWGVLAVNRGGMASHGGIVGVIIAAWWLSRGMKTESGDRVGRCPPAHAMDICAMIAPAGLFFGRLANFVNGELLGKVAAMPGEKAPWWAVRYPQEWISDQPLVQSLEQRAAIEALTSPYLRGEDTWIDGYERMLRAIQHGDTVARDALAPYLSARHPTQLYQAAVEGLLVGLVVWLVGMKRRRPGVIGAWFLITYAVGRVMMDFVRLPDPGISQFGGLTRGQVYSLVMLIAGLVVLVWASRSRAERMSGGWLRRPAA